MLSLFSLACILSVSLRSRPVHVSPFLFYVFLLTAACARFAIKLLISTNGFFLCHLFDRRVSILMILMSLSYEILMTDHAVIS